MVRTVVGIVRGGTSNEYQLSLKTGAAMLTALPDDQYDTRDILVDRSGVWHLQGKPVSAAHALAGIDVALNALHGGVGEDGSVARILHRAGVPYAGSVAHASALAFHKPRAREALQMNGILMPRGISFTASQPYTGAEMAQAVFEKIGPPYVIKPAQSGSSHGIRIARSILELPQQLPDVLDEYGAALVEEFISGDDASVGLIERFRGEELYALPPAHVVAPTGSRIIESQHHYQSLLDVRVPSRFSHGIKQALMDIARRAHRALGLEHFSSADFRITPNDKIYLLEVDALPALHRSAAFPAMLQSVGSSLSEFLEHSIRLARSAR